MCKRLSVISRRVIFHAAWNFPPVWKSFKWFIYDPLTHNTVKYPKATGLQHCAASKTRPLHAVIFGHTPAVIYGNMPCTCCNKRQYARYMLQYTATRPLHAAIYGNTPVTCCNIRQHVCCNIRQHALYMLQCTAILCGEWGTITEHLKWNGMYCTDQL